MIYRPAIDGALFFPGGGRGQGGNVDAPFIGQLLTVPGIGFAGDEVFGVDADAPKQVSAAHTVGHMQDLDAFAVADFEAHVLIILECLQVAM